MVEDIEENIDPNIDPIVNNRPYKEGKTFKIAFGNKDIPYNTDFKLFLTTKLSNPHYLPEVFIQTTIINFTVTFEGL